MERKCTYNHESWGDRSLAYSEEESGGKQATETLAGGMAKQRNRPKEDIDTWPKISIGRFNNFFFDEPHPFPDGPPLESQALGVHEKEVREEKDRPEPVKLVCRKVVRLTNAHGSSDEMNWDRVEFTHMIPSTADWPSAILSMKVTL